MMSAPKPRWAVPLYRAIIRASGHFDTQPLARILLGAPLLSAASKTKATDHDIAKLGEMSGKVCDEGQAIAGSALSGAVDELRRACTDEVGSSPTRLDLVRSPLSFRGALLRQLRAARVAEANNSSEAVGDAGFALLLELGTACDLSERLIAPAPLRESSATERLPPSEQAESLVGAVLASDPLAARTRLHEHTWAFAPSVALVLDDGREGGVASAVVTNARSSLKLRHHDWMSAMVAPLGGVFSEVPVYYGGDASLRTLTMLHPHGEHLPAARRVADGIYEGGYLADAAQLVRSGRAQPTDFVFFRGHSEWAAGRLAAEVAAGDWVRAPPPRVESAKWLDREMARVAQPSYTAQLPDDCIAEPAALAAAWETWAALVRRCGRAYRPLLRLRPAAFRAIVEAAAYSNLASVLSRPPSLDEELPAYAKGDGRDEWVAEEDKY